MHFSFSMHLMFLRGYWYQLLFQDYAIETSFERSPASSVDEVKIAFDTNSSIAAINFVLKVCSAVLLG